MSLKTIRILLRVGLTVVNFVRTKYHAYGKVAKEEGRQLGVVYRRLIAINQFREICVYICVYTAGCFLDHNRARMHIILDNFLCRAREVGANINRYSELIE